MANWPAGLPQAPLLQGFSQVIDRGTIRTQMDAGPAKVRRRYTVAIDVINFSLLLGSTEATTLENFYTNTLNGGSTSFTGLTNNITGSTADTFRFVSPPEFTRQGLHFLTRISLETIP